MEIGGKQRATAVGGADVGNAGEFETALKEMADTVAMRVGQSYHDGLARYLSTHFGLNIALVGRLDDGGESITSLAIAEDGVLLPNITYPLAGTPCDVVMRENACFYGEHLQALFPDDRWFQEVGAEGYAGIRLLDTDGKPIGIVSAISRTALPNIASLESFFKLAATRASTELDRARKSAEAEASELRYALAESGTADGLWDIDLKADRTYFSPRFAELLGLSPEALGDDVATVWARMHPDDVPRARAAREAHVQRNAPLDVQFRLRHASGAYHWFRTRGKALCDADGNPVRITGALTDITEGKLHQALLRAENAWLAKFAQSPSLEDLLTVMTGSVHEFFDDAAFNAVLLDGDGAPEIFPVRDNDVFDTENVRALLALGKSVNLRRGDARWPRTSAETRFEHAWVVPVAVDGVAQRAGLLVFYADGIPQRPYERQFIAAAERLIRLALDRARKEADLRRQRLLFENLFECAPQAMVILDRDDCVLDANPGFTEVFHYEREEVRGRALNELVVPREFAVEARRLSIDAMRGTTVARESFRCRKDGTLVPVSILGAPVTVPGSEASYFAIYRDQSSLHEAAQKLDHQSRHDQLTGLPNRYEFERRLRHAMSIHAEGRGFTGVVYFDLDQFKVVNDTTSHARGDELLEEIVQRLKPLVPAPHLLARLGGDEFGVLLVNGHPEDCEDIAQRIRERLGEEPFRLGERTFTITASFGIVTVHAGAEWSPQEVLSLADSTCFLAKERGRNRVQVYDPADTGVALRREEMDWISRLNEALVEQRFQLHHQRIVSLDAADSLAHHEILLRMTDHDGKIIPPGVFIPPAERYNLMPRIDRWVLESVFSRLDAIGTERQERLMVAVNVSGNTLSDEGLADFVARLFEQHAVRPQSVCFEITETAAIANFDDALRFIDVVRRLGCKVALDDFGSGLSSFRYLKQIAPDYLKIDGSFVREIARSHTDYSMVEAISRIGRTFGIHTVAEFVEDDSVLDALRRIGVDYAQGYGLHRPEPWNL